MAFIGIEPEGVRLLADRLVATADLADELAFDIGRAVFDSGLASAAPEIMRGLAGELVDTGALLHGRADSAQRLVLDLALQTSLMSVARSVVIDAPCRLGPSTAVGFASPCDPVESIKLYTVAAGAYIPLAGFAGVKLDAAYMLRVEYLRSGRLRVTRIEEGALGLVSGPGMDGEIHTGKLTTTSGASAKAWIQLLMAHGTTYEIGGSELDEFIATDLLDLVTRRFSMPASLGSTGFYKSVAKKVVGFADRLPLWKLHDAITALRKRLDWTMPEPLSRFTEGGVTAGVSGGVGFDPSGPLGPLASLAKKVPTKGKVGLSFNARAVVGVESRDNEQTIYLDIRSEIATPISYRLFGVDLSKLAGFETKIGLVRDVMTGEFSRIEFTIVTQSGKNIERHTAVIDLRDPATHPAAQRLVDDLTDPSRLPDAIDAMEKLLGHRVTTEQATLRNMGKSTYGVEGMGNSGKFTVETLDVR
ncbi:MAG TPA: hypothetical protein VM282_24575 [Acidimicrobiales bacterium]|nr:hypothetical protein [Acidimicrobiales bacterium]